MSKNIKSQIYESLSVALVSIVIPIYNAEKYLQQCLDSLRQQSYQNLEIICIDDGSTDNSAQILGDYAKKDARIKIIHQRNKGAGAARNVGLRAAHGKYVLFLDADDYFAPSLVEKLFLQAEAGAADICICKAWAVSGDNKLTSMNFDNRIFSRYDGSTISAKEIMNNLLTSFSVEPWNKLYNRKFLLDIGAEFQALKKTNDLFFTTVMMMSAQRISLVDEELVYYRLDNRYKLIADYNPSVLNFYDALLAVRKYMDAHGELKIFEKTFFNMAMEVIFYNLCLNMSWQIRIMLLFHLTESGLKNLGFMGVTARELPFWCRIELLLFKIRAPFAIQEGIYKMHKALAYYRKNSLKALAGKILKS